MAVETNLNSGQSTTSLHTQNECEALLAAAGQSLAANADQALKLAQEARQRCLRFANMQPAARRNCCRSWIIEGQVYLQKATYDAAIPAFLKALEYANQNSEQDLFAHATLGLGSSYLMMENYPEALQHLLRALTFYRNQNDLNGQTRTLLQLGELQFALQKPAKAQAYLEKALEISRKNSDPQLQAQSLNALCRAHQASGNTQRAIQLGLQSAELFQQINDHLGEARVYNTLGEISLSIGDLAQALNFQQLTAEVSQQTGQRSEYALALNKIGAIYLQDGKIELALENLTQAMEIAYQNGTQKILSDIHFNLSTAYKISGDYRAALEHFEKYYILQKKIFDSDSDRRLKTIEIVHQVESARKNAEIYELRNGELQKVIEDQKKAQQELEHLATHDPLTGLVNRRQFMDLASQAIEQARRYKRPYSVMMIDIDHFKNINDTFGHSAGDQILVEAARCMRGVLRKADIFSRFGGDEFVLLLPETSKEGARRLSERLRVAVAQRTEMVEGISMPITVSIGLTSHLSDTKINLDQLLQEADKALYISKHGGRDRVTLYEDTALIPPTEG